MHTQVAPSGFNRVFFGGGILFCINFSFIRAHEVGGKWLGDKKAIGMDLTRIHCMHV